MSRQKKVGWPIACGLFWLGVAISPVSARRPELKSEGLSICEVVRNEEGFIGKSIDLVAVYKTDNATYAYFTDPSAKKVPCDYPAIMEGQSAALAKDSSVKRFLKESMDVCNDGAGSCIQSAIVHFRATVISKDGASHLCLTRVYSYKFLEKH